MQRSQLYLKPILDNVAALLEEAPHQHAQFERWALGLLLRLKRAAAEGAESLRDERRALQDELELLQTAQGLTRVLSVRTERVRLCQRQWLTGVLDLMDELEPSHPSAWAA